MAGRVLDGVLCNTHPYVIEEVMPQLGGVTRSGSWALLSGIREGEESRIEAACSRHGWEIDGWRASEGWALAEAHMLEEGTQ